MQGSAKTFAALIAAGGSGSRFSGSKTESKKPKQFLSLKGMPLYAWSLIEFGKHESISEIVMMTPADLVASISLECEQILEQHHLRIKPSIIAGGKTRQESVLHGLRFLASSGSPPDYVMTHDAARPFLNKSTIDVIIDSVTRHGACTVGGAVTDTIKRVNSAKKIIETIPRDELFAVQTPQASDFSSLLAAHEKAEQLGFSTTDDTALLEWCGHEVFVVDGPKYNMKVTQPFDLVLAEALAEHIAKTSS
jgi:2-C-methyl-D-erythritol 4-phosphate cytidylyltransferase